MIKVPIHTTFVSPSLDFIKYRSSLMVVAAYAKAANQIELYKQAKETYDKVTRQYNEKTAPKKKGFWEQFKDNLTFNMDSQVALSISYLEDDSDFLEMIEAIKRKSSFEIQKGLREAILVHNSLFRK